MSKKHDLNKQLRLIAKLTDRLRDCKDATDWRAYYNLRQQALQAKQAIAQQIGQKRRTR